MHMPRGMIQQFNELADSVVEGLRQVWGGLSGSGQSCDCVAGTTDGLDAGITPPSLRIHALGAFVHPCTSKRPEDRALTGSPCAT